MPLDDFLCATSFEKVSQRGSHSGICAVLGSLAAWAIDANPCLGVTTFPDILRGEQMEKCTDTTPRY
jgi:hypothetical protein